MIKNIKKKTIIMLNCALLLIYSVPPISISAAEELKVDITIDTSSDRKLISPYIYGINDTADLSSLTVRSIKQGGERFSTYNWENNFSNEGSLWFNTSDNSLVSEFNANQQKQPALVIQSLINKSAKYNIPFTITTLPLSGFAAADGNGPILDNQVAPSDRWVNIQNKKGSLLSLNPDLDDKTVYVDEYVNYIINKYGKSNSTQSIKAYALDHEPDIWSTSQKAVHPANTTCQEIVQESADLANVIKSLDPNAMVLGGQFSGIKGCISFNDAPDWEINKGNYNWFVDYYLSEMKKKSQAEGKRLLDVLDIHYYSEDAVNGCGTVTNCSNYSHIACNKQRIQSTRTLWDGSYTENSWLGQTYKQYTPLIPTIQASINKNYSGTKLAFTEYNFGGGGDISGGIAQVDALGNFAKEGVYLACLNPDNGDIKYQKAAINIFTNYDGEGSAFGNTIVKSTTSNQQYNSVYSSIDNTNENVLKIILVNKNYDTSQTSNITINSSVQYKGGSVYSFNSKNSVITKLNNVKNINNNTFSYQLPPRSVAMIVLTNTGVVPEVTTGDYSDNFTENMTSVGENITSIEEGTKDTNITTKISQSDTLSIESEIVTDLTSSSSQIDPVDLSRKFPVAVKILIVIIIAIIILGLGYLFISDYIIKK